MKILELKFVGISTPYSSLWLRCFPVAKMSKAQYRTGIEIWIQSWRFLLYMDNHFFFIVRINKNQRTSILVHFVGWLFHVLQTLANQWLPNYNINMISSNILLLGSFFSQHRPFDTLWVQLHYTLTP